MDLRRRVLLLVGLVGLLWAGLPAGSVSAAPGDTTLLGIKMPSPGFGAGGQYVLPPDNYTLPAMADWQGGKANAIANFYGGTDLVGSTNRQTMEGLWAAGAVPSISLGVVGHPYLIGNGFHDAQIDAHALFVKGFVQGPDGIYGNADDRRVYMRPAWEMNGSWMAWSPCNPSGTGGNAGDFRKMWQRMHSRYAHYGMDRTRVAWIFSVNQSTSGPACQVKDLYPGSQYVDMVGIDGYTWVRSMSPEDVFGPMKSELATVAPGKPLSINEVGVHIDTVGGKGPWITELFAWAHTNKVHHVAWFNIDKANEGEFAIFGGSNGNEVFTSSTGVHNAWSEYRVAAAQSWVVGADFSNPRRLTDAQFLGL